MVQFKKMLSAGLAALVLASGCAVSHLRKEVPEITSPAVQTQISVSQDEEQVRIDAFQKDIEERVAQFGPTLEQDFLSGRLRVGLESLPQEVESLNASYSDLEDRDHAKISLQCQPQHQKCYTDALEHEIGHHIYRGLSPAQKKEIGQAIKKRLQEKDAQAFQEETTQIDQCYGQLAKIISQQVVPVKECKTFLDNLSFGVRIIKKLDAAGIEFAPTLVADFKAKGAKYISYMPDCTSENLRQAQGKLSSIKDKIIQVGIRIEDLYHHKTSSSSELPKVDLTAFPLQPIEDTSSYRHAESDFFNALEAIIDERIRSNQIAPESEAGQKLMDLYFKLQMYQTLQGTSSTGMNILEMQSYMGGHDSQREEQFAAVIDSLVDGYRGPVSTGPMKLSLDEPLLQVLEKLEYQGETILASPVEKYRTKLEEEKK